MPTQQEIDRKRMMAQMLMQNQAPQGQQAGRFYVAPSAFSQIASAGQNVAGMYMGRQADTQQETLDESTKAQLAETIKNLAGAQGGGKGGFNPAMAASLAAAQGLSLEDQEALVRQMAVQGLQPEQPIDPVKVGAGESLIDPRTGESIYQGQAKPGRLVQTLGPDGKPIYTPESEAAGMTAYSRPAGGVSVNLKNEGAIPAEHKAIRDEQGNIVSYERIPGGPSSVEADAAAEAATNLQEGKEMQGDIVTQEIDRTLKTLESPSLPETGMVGNLLKGVPGTDAHSVQNFLQTIKANIGFDKLQAMREASPTGGALGQVSEREIDFLQAVLGSLSQSQSKEDLSYNLNRLWNTYQDVIHGPGAGPERRPLTTPQEAAPHGQPPAGPAGPQAMPDFSTLSEEELKRLASGG